VEEAYYFLSGRVTPYYPQFKGYRIRFVSIHVSLSFRETVSTIGTLQVDEELSGRINRNFRLSLSNTQFAKSEAFYPEGQSFWVKVMILKLLGLTPSYKAARRNIQPPFP
jgi:hypothetical protein